MPVFGALSAFPFGFGSRASGVDASAVAFGLLSQTAGLDDSSLAKFEFSTLAGYHEHLERVEYQKFGKENGSGCKTFCFQLPRD